jgi:hypothetical protein
VIINPLTACVPKQDRGFEKERGLITGIGYTLTNAKIVEFPNHTVSSWLLILFSLYYAHTAKRFSFSPLSEYRVSGEADLPDCYKHQ